VSVASRALVPAALVLVLGLPVPAPAAEPEVPRPAPVAIVQTRAALAETAARRIAAELATRGYLGLPSACVPGPVPPAESPFRAWQTCFDPATARGPRIAIAATAAEVVAWIDVGGRTAGPFPCTAKAVRDPAELGRFASELVVWVESLLTPTPAPSARVAAPVQPPALVPPPPETTAAAALTAAPPPAAKAPRPALSLGAGTVAYTSLAGLGAGVGPELSAALEWADSWWRLVDRWGVRATGWISAWGVPIEKDGVAIRRAPVIGLIQLTAAVRAGAWWLEGHLGGGADWTRLSASTGAMPFKEESRAGFVAGVGLGLSRPLVRKGGAVPLSVALSLSFLSQVPRQVVVIGEHRFGDSRAPTIGVGAALRWGQPR
jgi:hypothetical protein